MNLTLTKVPSFIHHKNFSSGTIEIGTSVIEREKSMRLWHEKLIQFLPRNQLLGQHRECCALRGKGWGKKHSTVDYVFRYSPYVLYKYHTLVMEEMKRRGYRVSEEWFDKDYRGKSMAGYENLVPVEVSSPVYQEHDRKYLDECVRNLENKKIFLKIEEA